MRIGLVRAVLVISGFSVLASILITGAGMRFTAPTARYESWLYLAIIAPALVSPMVAAVIMSLAYRLDEAQQALARLALTDPLTGIGNRRQFIDDARRELARAAREGTGLSLLLIDIDHFKLLNDRFGHAAGDEALMRVARHCAGTCRVTDIVCRWGGEEFGVLMPATSQQEAAEIAERLRADIAALDIEGIPEAVTVSIGVAHARGPDLSLDALMHEADRQLYIAKDDGRNRVSTHGAEQRMVMRLVGSGT